MLLTSTIKDNLMNRTFYKPEGKFYGVRFGTCQEKAKLSETLFSTKKRTSGKNPTTRLHSSRSTNGSTPLFFLSPGYRMGLRQVVVAGVGVSGQVYNGPQTLGGTTASAMASVGILNPGNGFASQLFPIHLAGVGQKGQ